MPDKRRPRVKGAQEQVQQQLDTVSADTLSAEKLAELLTTAIFDVEDAARFLNIERNSVEYAAYRRRIPYVQYGAKKLFTRQDLLDYSARRGRGRDSRLDEAPVFMVKGPNSGKE